MSGDWEPWTFTSWGEDTYEERAAMRQLAEVREGRLRACGVDPRLIDFVWRFASITVSALVRVDLRNVDWLDRRVVAEQDADAVPLCALEFEARGVIARPGGLFEAIDGLETEVDTSWVWEQMLGDGLRGWSGDPDACEALVGELALLGGPALEAFARDALSRPR